MKAPGRVENLRIVFVLRDIFLPFVTGGLPEQREEKGQKQSLREGRLVSLKTQGIVYAFFTVFRKK